MIDRPDVQTPATGVRRITRAASLTLVFALLTMSALAGTAAASATSARTPSPALAGSSDPSGLSPLGDPRLAADALGTQLGYTSLVPARLADTRPGRTTVDGQFVGRGVVDAGSPLTLTIGGRGGVPTSGVVAAALNVTVTGPAGSGYVTVYPRGDTRPTASNVNYAGGQTVANSVVAKLGTGGQVIIHSYAPAHVVVDVSGYFRAGGIDPLSPARLADSRPGRTTTDGLFSGGGALTDRGAVELTVAGRGGVTADATAVSLNVTATEPTGSGFLTVFPSGTTRPGASTVNFSPGQTVANSVIAKVGVDGKVTVYNSGPSAHFVVDVGGYFSESAGFVPLDPGRFADTRSNGVSVAGRPGQFTSSRTSTRIGPIGQTVSNGNQIDVLITGRGGVPLTDVGAVVMNVKVVRPDSGGHLSVFPLDTALPTVSSLNFDAGRTVSNLVIAKVGRGGGISVLSSVGSSHVVIDVLGYFPGQPTADVDGQWASIGHDELYMPLVYDRCYPIYFQINPSGAQPGWVVDVRSAVAQLESATGVDFIEGPLSSEIPAVDRDLFDGNGYPLPVLIAFPTPSTISELSGNVIGYGGSIATGYGNEVRWLPTQFLSGFSYFDSTEALTAGFGSGNTFGKVALHELGHVVGLGHVDNSDELMNAYLINRSGGYGPGDLFGLGLLYGTQACPGSPATFGALGSGRGKTPPIERENVQTVTALDAFRGDHDD